MKHMVISTFNNQIQLFDCINEEVVGTYIGHQNSAYPLDFDFLTSLKSTSDIFLLSGSENGSVCYWNLTQNQSNCSSFDVFGKDISNILNTNQIPSFNTGESENNYKSNTVNCITNSKDNDLFACSGFPDSDYKICVYEIK